MEADASKLMVTEKPKKTKRHPTKKNRGHFSVIFSAIFHTSPLPGPGSPSLRDFPGNAYFLKSFSVLYSTVYQAFGATKQR
jgi:hypothetical protein